MAFRATLSQRSLKPRTLQAATLLYSYSQNILKPDTANKRSVYIPQIPHHPMC